MDGGETVGDRPRVAAAADDSALPRCSAPCFVFYGRKTLAVLCGLCVVIANTLLIATKAAVKPAGGDDSSGSSEGSVGNIIEFGSFVEGLAFITEIYRCLFGLVFIALVW